MAGVATYRSLALLMAVDAPLHFQILLKLDYLLRGDITVAGGTLNLPLSMLTVAEEDKSRQLMNRSQWNLAVRHLDVTDSALRDCRKTGTIGLCRIRMAGNALQLQRSVLPVIEGTLLTCSQQDQGREKATNESE
jgi:hypothetical protein